MRDSPWTPEKVSKLERMWNDNELSSTEIGLRLHVSKNAVISKARSLQLKPKGKTKKYKKKTIIRPHFRGLEELPEGQCKFIKNDGFFCGVDAIKRESYCKAHKKIMYLSPKKLEEIKARKKPK